jgi:hypothetical protein
MITGARELLFANQTSQRFFLHYHNRRHAYHNPRGTKWTIPEFPVEFQESLL